MKGLIFCSRIDEAKELSGKFNEKGWRTLVLSGSDSETARTAAIERLAGDENEDALDYIISVDIFSEGVDVPEINQAIDNANFSDIKLIRENYVNLKNKLGHIPALADFDKYGEMDVLRIFDNNSLGSYYKFLVKYEKEYMIRLSADEEKVIEFVSKKLANGKRIHELELLKRLLKYQHGLMGILKKSLCENYNCSMDANCTENIVNMMTILPVTIG
ncbi:MAG: DEAD/DEAH box helicase [Lachnospiraceae bacterium]